MSRCTAVLTACLVALLPSPSTAAFPACTPGGTIPGTVIMSQYTLDLLPLYSNILILVALTIFFRIVAYIALRRTTQP
jgi:hypothetical protein